LPTCAEFGIGTLGAILIIAAEKWDEMSPVLTLRKSQERALFAALFALAHFLNSFQPVEER
jgi:hypothetical protein